ncbi:MAG TPA: class I SAM-dependent methyltransferase [Candidatus Limnocylindrales bacterium]|nr:class I SAM-dependent methyltransferase [Candidatus Limnocylindrales bacterium]
MAEIRGSTGEEQPKVTYDIDRPQKFVSFVERHPLLLKKFLDGARGRANDMYERGELGNEIQSGERVLYLGAGTGHVAQAIEQRTGATTLKLDLGDLRTSDTKDGKFVIGDASKLPFADNSSDAVVLNNILHFCEDGAQEEILSEAMRTLRPGGKLILLEETMPTMDSEKKSRIRSIFGRFDEVLNRQPGGSTPHTYKSIEEWNGLAEAKGFDQARTRSWYWGPTDLIGITNSDNAKDTRTNFRPFESTRFVFTKPPRPVAV